MRNIESLRDRLANALVESAQAERVWRRAMSSTARPTGDPFTDLADRKRIDGLSGNRDRANVNVEALRAAIAKAAGPGWLAKGVPSTSPPLVEPVLSKARIQHRHLVAALRESRTADATWQRAVADEARGDAPATRASRRNLDDLWRKREDARERVSGLRWVDHGVLDGTRRRGEEAPPLA